MRQLHCCRDVVAGGGLDFITRSMVSKAMVAAVTKSSEVDPLEKRDEPFGWLATDVSRLMRTIFDRRVRQLGLTRPQWLALVRVQRRPGASQSELADMMEMEKAPAGRIVDRLVEKGWLERRPDPNDRRINRVYLTELGERVYAAIQPTSEATVADALADLPAADQERLIALMTRVKARLVEIAESDPSPEIAWADDLADGSADPEPEVYQRRSQTV